MLLRASSAAAPESPGGLRLLAESNGPAPPRDVLLVVSDTGVGITPEEQELIERAATSDRWSLVTMMWSAKESALKALHEGLRRDTRSVVVKPATLSCGEAWSSIEVHSMEGECFHGWWRETGGAVQTVVADAYFSPPIQLQAGNSIDCESEIDAA